jgi:hypothetical protein
MAGWRPEGMEKVGSSPSGRPLSVIVTTVDDDPWRANP